MTQKRFWLEFKSRVYLVLVRKPKKFDEVVETEKRESEYYLKRIVKRYFDQNDQNIFLGNSDCFNGHSLGLYTGDILPLTSPGQEKNQFKSFGGNAEDYAKLTALR